MGDVAQLERGGRDTERRLADRLPETAQPLNAAFRRIACNNGGVDRSDLNPCHQIGMQARFGERLVDAALICAERPTALQH